MNTTSRPITPAERERLQHLLDHHAPDDTSPLRYMLWPAVLLILVPLTLLGVVSYDLWTAHPHVAIPLFAAVAAILVIRHAVNWMRKTMAEFEEVEDEDREIHAQLERDLAAGVVEVETLAFGGGVAHSSGFLLDGTDGRAIYVDQVGSWLATTSDDDLKDGQPSDFVPRSTVEVVRAPESGLAIGERWSGDPLAIRPPEPGDRDEDAFVHLRAVETAATAAAG